MRERTTKERNAEFARSHYTEEYSWLPLLIIIATQKRDTITTNATFSFNGRRLVTSLILVITSIILLALLLVNLEFIKFTEATVNTTTSASPLSPTPTTAPPTSTSTSPPLSSAASVVPALHIVTSPKPGGPEVDININNTITSGPALLAKIKDTNLTGGATPNATTTGDSAPMAVDQRNATKTSTAEDGPQGSPCATPTPDRNSLTSSGNDTSRYFDIDYASKTFQDSMEDKNAISLHHYLNGFKELMKFFHSLGTIFLFVTSDLETKIGLLEGYRNTEMGGCNPAYLTIQSAIEYETKENLLRDTKRQSGARTILRLHRALEFLSSLMLNLSKLTDDAETAPAAREAYSNTLAKHHPWTIRTIASFAMRTLPHKKTLVESVLGKENIVNETVTNEKMLMLANVTEILFNVVDKYYEENNIKDLP